MNNDSDDKHQERHSRPLPTGEPVSGNGTHLVAIDRDGVAVEGGAGGTTSPTEPAELEKEKGEPVTWASLPHRTQLIILTLARLSEPLVQTSLQVSRSLIDMGLLNEWLLICFWDRHICSISSNPSTRASLIPSSQHRLDLWRVALPALNF